MCSNKVVFNWTFCQSLLCLKKNPIVRKYKWFSDFSLFLIWGFTLWIHSNTPNNDFIFITIIKWVFVNTTNTYLCSFWYLLKSAKLRPLQNIDRHSHCFWKQFERKLIVPSSLLPEIYKTFCEKLANILFVALVDLLLMTIITVSM